METLKHVSIQQYGNNEENRHMTLKYGIEKLI